MNTVPPRSGGADVSVWYAETRDFPFLAEPDAPARWLTGVDRQRYDRFAGDDDRRMFLLGRAMARSLVGAALGVPPAAWEWREGSHGRPEIARPATSVRFNLTHSAGLVACALADRCDVGVDVEDLQRRPVDPAVVARYCTPEEIADIAVSREGWHDRFLRYWTLKEAYLKARGLGIAVPLAEIGFRLDDHRARIVFRGSLAGADDRWALVLTQPTSRHILAAAAEATDGAAPTWRIEALPANHFA